MQDRYAGDVGDFIKLGLIRHLAAADLAFGVNWYLTPDEAHNADGKHVAYVEPGNRQHASLKACDLDLMRCLTGVVAGSRSVQALEDSGALPVGALTFGEVLDVLPEDLVNPGEGWPVADGAVVASRVVVLQPVWQGSPAGV